MFSCCVNRTIVVPCRVHINIDSFGFIILLKMPQKVYFSCFLKMKIGPSWACIINYIYKLTIRISTLLVHTSNPLTKSLSEMSKKWVLLAYRTSWNLNSDGWFIGKQTSKYTSVYCMYLLLPFKLFLPFLNQAKKKEERNQCYSQ